MQQAVAFGFAEDAARRVLRLLADTVRTRTHARTQVLALRHEAR